MERPGRAGAPLPSLLLGLELTECGLGARGGPEEAQGGVPALEAKLAFSLPQMVVFCTLWAREGTSRVNLPQA